jgi:hypothetical protein
MKRISKLAILCGIAGFLASTAWADDIHVTLDPNTPITGGDYGLVKAQGVTYSVTWVSCSGDVFSGTGLEADNACLAFINKTNAPITDLSFSFNAPAGNPLVGQTVMCDNTDGFLTQNNCGSAAPEGILAGTTYTFDFSGGTAIPSEMAFYIGETGVLNLSDINADNWSVTAPEPGTLVLSLGGLMLLFVLRHRRSLVPVA